MASKTFALLVIVAVVVVAVVADFEDLDPETKEDMDFIQRDPEIQELFMAEKRGFSMKKYKFCPQFSQDCWCNRRTRRVVFCNGNGNGDGM